MKLIADSGLLVAYLNCRDRYHDWAVQIVESAQLPLLTCEPVITETAWHLRDASGVLKLLALDALFLGLDCKIESAALLALSERYKDREPDFADLCVIRLSELFSGYKVATVDLRDFIVYRRFKNQVIPIVHP